MGLEDLRHSNTTHDTGHRGQYKHKAHHHSLKGQFHFCWPNNTILYLWKKRLVPSIHLTPYREVDNGSGIEDDKDVRIIEVFEAVVEAGRQEKGQHVEIEDIRRPSSGLVLGDWGNNWHMVYDDVKEMTAKNW